SLRAMHTISTSGSFGDMRNIATSLCQDLPIDRRALRRGEGFPRTRHGQHSYSHCEVGMAGVLVSRQVATLDGNPIDREEGQRVANRVWICGLVANFRYSLARRR